MDGDCTIQLSTEEEQYFKECLVENSTVTSMEVPWNSLELESILARNKRTAEDKRFKITKLAVQ